MTLEMKGKDRGAWEGRGVRERGVPSIYIYISIYLYIYIYLSVCLSVYLSIYLSISFLALNEPPRLWKAKKELLFGLRSPGPPTEYKPL